MLQPSSDATAYNKEVTLQMAPEIVEKSVYFKRNKIKKSVRKCDMNQNIDNSIATPATDVIDRSTNGILISLRLVE